jgi:protein-disulfide isomerase
MRRLVLFLLGVVLAFAPLASAPAQEFTREQKAQLDKLIRDYILENPEIIIEAIERLEEKRSAGDQPGLQQLADARGQVFRDPETPTANPTGSIPVVLFTDYRCGYCKKMVPDIRRLRQEARDVRLVFKDLPILGPDSVTAARAALAARAQGKYEVYHFALMEHKGGFSEDRVLAIAKQAGLDPDQLKRDMKDPKIDAQLEANLALAKQLKIRGTPALIIGESFVMGSADYATLTKLVEKARTSCRVC